MKKRLLFLFLFAIIFLSSGVYATCNDSDGGINFYVYGLASLSNGSFVNDTCWGPFIEEGYCNGSTLNIQGYACPNGCGGGKCLGSNTTQTCSENDGGSNLIQKSSTIGVDASGSFFNYTDFCSGLDIREYWCSGETLNSDVFDCNLYGYGDCIDGKCFFVNTTSCHDGDGGLNYYTKASTYNSTYNHTDYCSGSFLNEGHCSGSTLLIDSYDCPFGCTNGYCENQTYVNYEYTVELISATDNSATLKIGSVSSGIYETKELSELESAIINGLQTSLISADETNTQLESTTKYNLFFTKNASVSSSFSMELVNPQYLSKSHYKFDLLTASDTSATIRVGNVYAGNSSFRQISEGDGVNVNGMYIVIISANESGTSRSVEISVQPFYSSIASLCGDANSDGIISITDAVYLINYMFASGPAPNPLLSGDADSNSLVTISDAVYLINYIFASGPAPCNPPSNWSSQLYDSWSKSKVNSYLSDITKPKCSVLRKMLKPSTCFSDTTQAGMNAQVVKDSGSTRCGIVHRLFGKCQ